MVQYRLRHLFICVAVIAIAIALTQVNWHATRYQKVGCLAFSPDSKSIAAALYTAYDAGVALKAYYANVSRTISILEAQSGTSNRLIDKKVLWGNEGPAREEYGELRTPVAFLSNDQLLVKDLGGGNLILHDLSRDSREPVRHNAPIRWLAMSGDRTLLATSSDRSVMVWRADCKSVVASFAVRGSSFLGSPAVTLSDDGRYLGTSSAEDLEVLEHGSGKVILQYSDSDRDTWPWSDDWPWSITFIPNSTELLVASMSSLQVVDFTTNRWRKICEKHYPQVYSIDSLGRLISFVDEDGALVLFNHETGQIERRLSLDAEVTSVSFSPDGGTVALGDNRGKVSLFDVSTGKLIWSRSLVAEPRSSWVAVIITVVVLFALWSGVRWTASTKRQSLDNL